jgi:twinkle protein
VSECIDKLPHEACGSSDALQVFLKDDGAVDGFCFACNTFVKHPYGEGEVPDIKPSPPEDKQAKVDAYTQHPWMTDLPSRKLRADSFKYFGCKMELSQQDGVTPAAILFPYAEPGKLRAWKLRVLDDSKRMWCIGALKPCMPFGWARAIRSGQRTLYITEGEFDAIALWQVLKDANRNTAYADNNPAVISLKSGSSSAKALALDLRVEINKHFDEVVLCFDMDEAGQEAATEVCRLCPSWKTATLPDKDPNDSLINGASKALKAAVVFRAEKPKNSRILAAASLHDMGRVQAEMGLSTPWDKLTEMSRGFRDGETWYWGAGVKMGKSELVNAIAAHMIKVHGRKVLLAKPEEAPGKSYKLLAGKIAGKIFHDPNIEFDYSAYDSAGEVIGDNAFFLDIYQFLDWKNLKTDIEHIVETEGVKDVIIDPITCFTNGMDPSTANTFLLGLASEAAALAKDLNILIHMFCHLNTPDGTPHERGGEVFSNQFAGSRGMMRSCNYMIAMEGNKDPALSIEERNFRQLKMLEDREFGVTGILDLRWDYKTGLFEELR